jgi:hypothetical protein
MGTKSIRHIVEDTLQTYLANADGLAGTVTFVTGDSNNTATLPKGIVLCESARAPGDLPEGLGNYSCSVRITLFSNADDTTITVHRARCALVVGNMRDLTSIKDKFTQMGDASCYDVTMLSEDEGVDERSWATAFTFDVLVVFPA